MYGAEVLGSCCPPKLTRRGSLLLGRSHDPTHPYDQVTEVLATGETLDLQDMRAGGSDFRNLVPRMSSNHGGPSRLVAWWLTERGELDRATGWPGEPDEVRRPPCSRNPSRLLLPKAVCINASAVIPPGLEHFAFPRASPLPHPSPAAGLFFPADAALLARRALSCAFTCCAVRVTQSWAMISQSSRCLHLTPARMFCTDRRQTLQYCLVAGTAGAAAVAPVAAGDGAADAVTVRSTVMASV